MTQTQSLSLFLDFAGKDALVVGGGRAGERKITSLLAADAKVTVVSPTLTRRLNNLADSGRISWIKSEFNDEQFTPAAFWLVVSATGVSAVDARVGRLCEAAKTWWVNSANPENSAATFAAQGTSVDGIRVAVSGDRDPKRSVAIRDAIVYELNLGLLDPGPLKGTSRTVGHVTLVGAGPGDPELITVRGLARIRSADVVVVDRLAPAVLWQKLPLEVEIIKVGKAPGQHSSTQDEINQIIVDRALKGQHVVRIKGGDPFVLGRGAEEAQACIAAGIPVEVVPGISSALAVPAAAGIPVTYRGVASSFLVISAHAGAKSVIPAIGDSPTDATLVLLMGASRIAQISAALIAFGYDPQTPIGIIESGLTPDQKVKDSTLEVVAAGKVSVENPSIIVVGDVVTLRDQLGDLTPSSHSAGFLKDTPSTAQTSSESNVIS